MELPRTTSELQDLVAVETARQLAPIREALERLPEERASLVVFSGDLDRVMAAFVIATGAAAAGLKTSIFFTFWGLSVVRKKSATRPRKNFKQRMFSAMTAGDSASLGTSKMNFLGLGSVMLRSMMKEQGIASLEELIAMARELGVTATACTMSMDAMGLAREELVDGLEYGGVAAFLADATRSRLTLFI